MLQAYLDTCSQLVLHASALDSLCHLRPTHHTSDYMLTYRPANQVACANADARLLHPRVKGMNASVRQDRPTLQPCSYCSQHRSDRKEEYC